MSIVNTYDWGKLSFLITGCKFSHSVGQVKMRFCYIYDKLDFVDWLLCGFGKLNCSTLLDWGLFSPFFDEMVHEKCGLLVSAGLCV